jgi:hypothetical protein
MRKNKKENEELTSGPGWAAYQEAPADLDEEDFDNTPGHHVIRHTFRDRLRINYKENMRALAFRFLIKRHRKVFFDLGPGNFGWFTEHQRFQPRAKYLLKNHWTQIQLGIYVIEYTIIDSVAYSHYSLNYGISYHLYMETQLSKQSEMNLEILVDLFKETEEFLHDSIVNGSAPYFPNFRIK